MNDPFISFDAWMGFFKGLFMVVFTLGKGAWTGAEWLILAIWHYPLWIGVIVAACVVLWRLVGGSAMSKKWPKNLVWPAGIFAAVFAAALAWG